MSNTDPLPTILAKLRQPIAAAEVKFRAGGSGVLAYIDARTVQERLDRVAPDWEATFTVVTVTERAAVIECHLTIGGVTRTDVGTGDGPEAVKSAYSDALKRAAVQFGVGRCLYDYRPPRKSVKGGLDGRDLEELRAHYSAWLGKKGEAKYGPVWADEEPARRVAYTISTTNPAGASGFGANVEEALARPVAGLPELRARTRDLVKAGACSYEDITVMLAEQGLDLTDAEGWGVEDRARAAQVLDAVEGAQA